MSQVSVCIPCYRYAHFLRECVESVLSQPGVDVRVLILDDASPDDTPAVAARLMAEDARVEYRRHTANQGHIATYNEGLAWAAGSDYTVLLSADDLLTPGALLRAASLMDAHPEVGFVYGSVVTFQSDQPRPQPRLPAGACTYAISAGIDWLKSVCASKCFTSITSPEVVVRTGLQQALGGYRPSLPHTGDMEMWMRFAAHASVARIVDADQAFYRIHQQNMHLQHFALRSRALRQVKAAFDALFQDYSHRIPHWGQLQRASNNVLASEALWTICQAYDHGEILVAEIDELLDFVHTSCSGGSWRDSQYMRAYASFQLRRLLGARLSARLRPLGAWLYRRQWLH